MNGVAFDVAFKLDDYIRFAWCVMINEIKTGRKYDFNSKKFIDPFEHK